MFSEHDIIANDELTHLVVKSTAEETKQCVESLVNIIQDQAEKISKEKLKGTPPVISTTHVGPKETKNFKTDVLNEHRITK